MVDELVGGLLKYSNSTVAEQLNVLGLGGIRGSGGGVGGGLSAPAANRTPIPWRLRAKERWCFFMSRC